MQYVGLVRASHLVWAQQSFQIIKLVQNHFCSQFWRFQAFTIMAMMGGVVMQVKNKTWVKPIGEEEYNAKVATATMAAAEETKWQVCAKNSSEHTLFIQC